MTSRGDDDSDYIPEGSTTRGSESTLKSKKKLRNSIDAIGLLYE